MFGNECCLSTGEVIKIIGLNIKKIIAEICEHIEDCEPPQPFELPMNFPGTVATASPSWNSAVSRYVHLYNWKQWKSEAFYFYSKTGGEQQQKTPRMLMVQSS